MWIVFSISFIIIIGASINWNISSNTEYNNTINAYWNLLKDSFVFLFYTKITIGINGNIKIFNGKNEEVTEPIISS